MSLPPLPTTRIGNTRHKTRSPLNLLSIRPVSTGGGPLISTGPPPTINIHHRIELGLRARPVRTPSLTPRLDHLWLSQEQDVAVDPLPRTRRLPLDCGLRRKQRHTVDTEHGRQRPTGPVTPVVASVVVSGDAAVTVGSTIQLAAQARDAAGAVIADKTSTWSSASDAVATVAISRVRVRSERSAELPLRGVVRGRCLHAWPSRDDGVG
jgi:hypothetical protein